MKRGLDIVCAAKLQTAQLERHLQPLAQVDRVNRIFLVRSRPLDHASPKIEQCAFSERMVALDAWTMFRKVDELVRRESIACVIGFNPLPWGSAAWAAARRRRVPVILSLLGSDFQRLLHPLAAPLWLPLKRAALVTVTGPSMAAKASKHGIEAERIRVLPHVIDTERFVPATAPEEYDAVFVGQLIAVKRVNLILDAVKLLRQRGRRLRLAIAGRGELENDLRAQARTNGIEDSVSFLGFRSDIERVLQSARILVMASRSEGLPFALIEAMASGLVPVVPDVGTVSDLVIDGHNGRLLRACSAESIAEALAAILDDRAAAARMREAALHVRETHAMSVGIAFWAQALEQVA